MSDNFEMGRPALGNSAGRWRAERQGEGNYSSYPHRRVLVEECSCINIWDLQQILGRSKMLKSADEGHALTFKLEGQNYEVFLCWEPHRLPGRAEKWSDIATKNCRMWMICNRCHGKFRILYRNPLVSDVNPEIACKKCLSLRYQSENCSGNLWWSKYAMPLKRLLRRQEKLLLQKRTKRVVEELDFLEGQIFVLRQRVKPKRCSRHISGVRRPYRSVDLVLGNR
jgi:hypothetical protein